MVIRISRDGIDFSTAAFLVLWCCGVLLTAAVCFYFFWFLDQDDTVGGWIVSAWSVVGPLVALRDIGGPRPGPLHPSLYRLHLNRAWWAVKFWLIGSVGAAGFAILAWGVPPLWCLTYPLVTLGPMLVVFALRTVPPRKKHP